MKGNGPMSALVLILALTMACGSENQGGLGPGGGAGYDRMYDPKTVATVAGEVVLLVVVVLHPEMLINSLINSTNCRN